MNLAASTNTLKEALLRAQLGLFVKAHTTMMVKTLHQPSLSWPVHVMAILSVGKGMMRKAVMCHSSNI